MVNKQIFNPFAQEIPQAVYIHVPFCLQKCNYCSFYSFKPSSKDFDLYTKALVEEISSQVRAFFGERKEQERKIDLSSLYFGGGTPSLLPLSCLEEIFVRLEDHFIFREDCEITLEANPGSNFISKLETYKKLGINRLSLGLQSSDDRMLVKLGRCHNYDDFLKSFEAARAAGFTNISLDLIFALPGQNLENFKKELDQVLTLEPDHLSFYSLQLEEGTPLGEALLADPSSLAGEEEERAMYHLLMNELPRHGLFPYEISNAARPGFESRHNSLYWQARPYFAFGPGASSYVNGHRRTNLFDFETWQDKISRNSLDIFEDEETINGLEARKEFMLLGFRMLEGVSEISYANIFAEDIDIRFNKELKKLQNRQLIENSGGFYRLTKQGRDLANQVFMEFI